MTPIQFTKVKDLFSRKINGEILSTKEDKEFSTLWTSAIVCPQGEVSAWVSKSRYYDPNPLKTWG